MGGEDRRVQYRLSRDAPKADKGCYFQDQSLPRLVISGEGHPKGAFGGSSHERHTL